MPPPATPPSAVKVAPVPKGNSVIRENVEPDGVVFDIQPAGRPIGSTAILFAGMFFMVALTVAPLVAGVLVWLLHLRGPGFLLLWSLACCAWGALLWRGLQQQAAQHAPSRIVVRPEGLVLADTLYQRAHIQQLWAHGPGTQTPDYGMVATVQVPSHAWMPVTATVQRSGGGPLAPLFEAVTGNMAKVSHTVLMRHGAETVTVASGLDAAAAEHLALRLRQCLQIGA